VERGVSWRLHAAGSWPSTGATIRLCVFYRVPSRLSGHRLRLRLYEYSPSNALLERCADRRLAPSRVGSWRGPGFAAPTLECSDVRLGWQETRNRVLELRRPVTVSRDIRSLGRMNDDRTDLAAQASRRAGARRRQVGAHCRRFAQGRLRGAARELPRADASRRPRARLRLCLARLRCGALRQGSPRSIRRRLAALPLHSCRGRSGGLEGGAPAQSRLTRLERTLARLAMKLKKRYPMRLA
jgi:hypothetical protein